MGRAPKTASDGTLAAVSADVPYLGLFERKRFVAAAMHGGHPYFRRKCPRGDGSQHGSHALLLVCHCRLCCKVQSADTGLQFFDCATFRIM